MTTKTMTLRKQISWAAAAGGVALTTLLTPMAAAPAQAAPDRAPVDVALGDSFMSGGGGQFAGSIYNFAVGVEPGRMAADKGSHNASEGVFIRD